MPARTSGRKQSTLSQRAAQCATRAQASATRRTGALHTLAEALDAEMDGSDRETTIRIIDRLAKLEGLLLGLQNSIGQSQQQWMSSQRKVELLEQRLVQLETSQVTKEDMKELSQKVDALINKNAQTSGSTGAANWVVRNGAQWVAVLLSVFAINEATSSKHPPEMPPAAHERRP